jgi:hypothetical protein
MQKTTTWLPWLCIKYPEVFWNWEPLERKLAVAVCREICNPTHYLLSIWSLEVEHITELLRDCEEIPKTLALFGNRIRGVEKVAVIREIVLDFDSRRIPDTLFWDVVISLQSPNVGGLVWCWSVSRDIWAPQAARELVGSRYTQSAEAWGLKTLSASL